MSRLPETRHQAALPENRSFSLVSIGLRLTGNRCQCTACGLPFSSVREFDRHRTGSYAQPEEPTHKRRCLTTAELTQMGWRTNAHGFWMQPRPEHAPVGLEGVPEAQHATRVAPSAGGP